MPLRPERLQALQRLVRAPAGDALLARLGENLASFVTGPRTRLPDGRRRVLHRRPRTPTEAELVVAGAARALARARRGLLRSPPRTAPSLAAGRGDDGPQDALRLADQRMYANKQGARAHGRRAVERRAAPRALRAAPEARRRTSAGVAELAEAVARQARARRTRRSRGRGSPARCTTIGKMAIPDAILEKPGPLTDDEWTVRPPAHADRRAHPARGARRSRTSPASCARAASASTAPAIRTASRARTSRSSRASSSSATRSTR